MLESQLPFFCGKFSRALCLYTVHWAEKRDDGRLPCKHWGWLAVAILFQGASILSPSLSEANDISDITFFNYYTVTVTLLSSDLRTWWVLDYRFRTWSNSCPQREEVILLQFWVHWSSPCALGQPLCCHCQVVHPTLWSSILPPLGMMLSFPSAIKRICAELKCEKWWKKNIVSGQS